MQNLKKLQYIVLNLGSGSCGSHRFLCCGPLVTFSTTLWPTTI